MAMFLLRMALKTFGGGGGGVTRSGNSSRRRASNPANGTKPAAKRTQEHSRQGSSHHHHQSSGGNSSSSRSHRHSHRHGMGKQRGKKQKTVEKLETMDTDLMSFFDFCDNMGFSSGEMDIICSPLEPVIPKRGALTYAKLAAWILFFCLALYTASQVETVATHAVAVGRILMIKALAVWDWRPLFNEPCLVDNPARGLAVVLPEDCIACESQDSINVVSGIRFKDLLDNYLNRDAPVIVTDAIDNWAVTVNPFSVENITNLYIQDMKMMETLPCVLTTNLRQGGPDVHSFLKLIRNPNLKKWFVHWQNCDAYAVKALRKFYKKPYFLPATVAPAHFNWIIMASDYNSKNFKKIDLDFGLIMLIQIRGKTVVQLEPVSPCNYTCPDLTATIRPGEILIWKNFLYNFKYLPGAKTKNIAIMTETVWERSTT